MSWLYDLYDFPLSLSVSLFNMLHTYLALGNRDVLTPEMRNARGVSGLCEQGIYITRLTSKKDWRVLVSKWI